MLKEITRHIRREIERELWALAAGRCEFDGCNRLVYKSPVTQERVNISEKAHIYSFSKHGPRGWGPLAFNKKQLNDISNLMLVCHFCHGKIDQTGAEERYPADRLIEWKRQHEARVLMVTGIRTDKKSHAILYGGKIGEEDSPLNANAAMEAMFPDWYPTEESPISLAMTSALEDKTDLFWRAEESHLRDLYERRIRPLISKADPNHLSVFARADQPLLILLGALITDKVPAEVYQLGREPVGWKWSVAPDEFSYRVSPSTQREFPPALIISLSAPIQHERITSVMGDKVAIWELTIDECHNDFLKCRSQLSAFRSTVRKLMVEIARAHGQQTPLTIFPAMPVACAVELGRVRMPKADMPWVIFDQNNKSGKFIEALRIGGSA